VAGVHPIRFVRYAMFGGVGTAAHFAVLVLLVQGASAGPVLASTAGAVVGLAVNYALNHRFTFASERRHAQAFPRFAAVAVAGMAVNAALIAALVHGAGTHYVLAQVCATLAVLVLTYLGNRAWTF
jgi:putative flippase GtrA